MRIYMFLVVFIEQLNFLTVYFPIEFQILHRWDQFPNYIFYLINIDIGHIGILFYTLVQVILIPDRNNKFRKCSDLLFKFVLPTYTRIV